MAALFSLLFQVFSVVCIWTSGGRPQDVFNHDQRLLNQPKKWNIYYCTVDLLGHFWSPQRRIGCNKEYGDGAKRRHLGDSRFMSSLRFERLCGEFAVFWLVCILWQIDGPRLPLPGLWWRITEYRRSPACSCIKIDRVVYEFAASDGSHPSFDEIVLLLIGLDGLLKLAGDVPERIGWAVQTCRACARMELASLMQLTELQKWLNVVISPAGDFRRKGWMWYTFLHLLKVHANETETKKWISSRAQSDKEPQMMLDAEFKMHFTAIQKKRIANQAGCYALWQIKE